MTPQSLLRTSSTASKPLKCREWGEAAAEYAEIIEGTDAPSLHYLPGAKLLALTA